MSELSSTGVSLDKTGGPEDLTIPDARVPSPRPKAPTRHRRWRLRFLLVFSLLLAMIYVVSQLEPATAEKLGPAGSFIYGLVHPNLDPEAISEEGRRLRSEVAKIGGRADFTDRTYRYLGRFGAVERFHIGFTDPKFGDAELAALVKKYGERIFGLSLVGTTVTDQGLRCLADVIQLQQIALGNFDRRPMPPDGVKVARNEITDAGLIHLKGLNQLRNLHLEGLPITDAGLDAIKDLPNLDGLYLSRTKVTGVGLGGLKSLPRLVVLGLADDELSEKGLEALSGAVNLQLLSVSHVPLTAKTLQSLKGLPRLNTVDLTGCGLLDEEVRDLKTSMPGLKILRQ